MSGLSYRSEGLIRPEAVRDAFCHVYYGYERALQPLWEAVKSGKKLNPDQREAADDFFTLQSAVEHAIGRHVPSVELPRALPKSDWVWENTFPSIEDPETKFTLWEGFPVQGMLRWQQDKIRKGRLDRHTREEEAANYELLKGGASLPFALAHWVELNRYGGILWGSRVRQEAYFIWQNPARANPHRLDDLMDASKVIRRREELIMVPFEYINFRYRQA